MCQWQTQFESKFKNFSVCVVLECFVAGMYHIIGGYHVIALKGEFLTLTLWCDNSEWDYKQASTKHER